MEFTAAGQALVQQKDWMGQNLFISAFKFDEGSYMPQIKYDGLKIT